MTIRDDALGGGGRRGRALIRDKIGDGKIRLVTHSADGRDKAPRDSPCHDLLIKRPQILDAAATATNDQDIALGAPIGNGDGLGDFFGTTLPLHGCGIQDYRHAGQAQL